MSSPYERFLGVSESADVFALLALTPGQTHPTAIERALESQLARVERHPDGAGAEANLIRKRLREAARSIHPGRPMASTQPSDGKNGVPAPAPGVASQPQVSPALQPPRRTAAAAPSNPLVNRLELTVFDRQVLATLVACGGWNAHSRDRLVSLAAAHRVSPTGLMKVVRGLSEYASSHAEVRIVDVSHITEGASRMDAIFPDAMAAPLLPDPGPDLMSQPTGGGAWATIKLSLLFGAATVLFGVLFIRVLLDTGEPPQEPVRVSHNDPEAPPSVVHATPLTYDPDRVQVGHMAVYPSAPTFRGDSSPPEAVAAADQSPRLPDLFDELGRKLTISDTPSRAFWVAWTDLTLQAGLCWPLLDPSTNAAVRENLMEVVFAAASQPSVTDQLLATLEGHADRVNRPLDVWVGSWAVGMLGEVAVRNDLPAASRSRALELTRQLIGRDTPEEQLGFDRTARAWLDLRPPRLVGLTATDEDIATT